MRILVLNYEYPPVGGGGGIATEHLAVELAKRHYVAVITSGYMGLPPLEQCHGVEVHRLPVFGRASKSVASLASMASFLWHARGLGVRIAAEFRPEVIHTWFALPTGPAGTWLSRRTGAPNLLTIVGGDIYDPSKRLSPHRWAVLRCVVRRTVMAADHVLAISSDVKQRACQHYHLDGSSIQVVPLGLPEPSFAPSDRAALGLPEEAFVVITVGRLVRRKAHERLIEALSLANDPTIMLVIVGDGPERGRLVQQAQQLGLASQVKFTGAVDEETKFQLLSASDVFALASLHEGFGIVFMEAMYCGLPVVTNLTGGQSDFLVHNENALIAAHNTPAEIAEAVTALRRDVLLRERLAQGARETVRQLSITNMAEQYEQVLADMVANRAKGE